MMVVADIMTTYPITIRPTHTLREAMETMEQVGCHHLPVISPQGHLVGIVTARDCRQALRLPDIVREYWQDEALADHLLARDVMSPAPIITEPDTPVAEAAELMLEQYVSCLPVMRGETLVGIITLSDVVMAFIRTQRHAFSAFQ
jgi:CBS domain-containing protein